MNRKSDEPCIPAIGPILFRENREYGLTYRLYRRAVAGSADDTAGLWQYDLWILQQSAVAGAEETGEVDVCELRDISRSLEEAEQIFRLFSHGLVMPCNAAEVMEELLSRESLPTSVLL